jgi:hypothetical protein
VECKYLLVQVRGVLEKYLQVVEELRNQKYETRTRSIRSLNFIDGRGLSITAMALIFKRETAFLVKYKIREDESCINLS